MLIMVKPPYKNKKIALRIEGRLINRGTTFIPEKIPALEVVNADDGSFSKDLLPSGNQFGFLRRFPPVPSSLAGLS